MIGHSLGVGRHVGVKQETVDMVTWLIRYGLLSPELTPTFSILTSEGEIKLLPEWEQMYRDIIEPIRRKLEVKGDVIGLEAEHGTPIIGTDRTVVSENGTND